MKLQQKNKRILYLYTGNHFVHRKLAESIGADVAPLSWKIPTNYDIYLSEGDYIKLTILKLIGKIRRTQKIAVLFSDPRLFYLNVMNKLNPSTQKIERISILKLVLSKFLINRLNGAICLSKFEEDLLKNIAPNIPRSTLYPFIEKKLFNQLRKIKPGLEKFRVLFIGNGPDWYYKGLDRFVEIAKNNQNIEFIVVGGNWESFLKKENVSKNVNFVGLKTPQQLRRYFLDASLYLHLGRGEAFGVSISEAMDCGIPCIVSDQTGAKEFVEKVSKEMIIGKEINKADEKIKEYFSLSKMDKHKLSSNFKKASEDLEEGKVLKKYKNKFGNFLERI